METHPLLPPRPCQQPPNPNPNSRLLPPIHTPVPACLVILTILRRLDTSPPPSAAVTVSAQVGCSMRNSVTRWKQRRRRDACCVSHGHQLTMPWMGQGWSQGEGPGEGPGWVLGRVQEGQREAVLGDDMHVVSPRGIRLQCRGLTTLDGSGVGPGWDPGVGPEEGQSLQCFEVAQILLWPPSPNPGTVPQTFSSS